MQIEQKWVDAVVYEDYEGEWFVRDQKDFLNKFAKL